jgi:hypothetical protein
MGRSRNQLLSTLRHDFLQTAVTLRLIDDAFIGDALVAAPAGATSSSGSETRISNRR